MQGRLSPPEDVRQPAFPVSTWKAEIIKASKLPLKGIEWIYDSYGEKINPILIADQKNEFLSLLKKYQVKINSICANYFMENPLVGIEHGEQEIRIGKLENLIKTSSEFNISRIVLPLLDNSSLKNLKEFDAITSILKEVYPLCDKLKVSLHIESDLEPMQLAKMLNLLPSNRINVNYDSGNSASLGYSIKEEFSAYGDRIGSLHIKDRLFQGGSVNLGRGNAKFDMLRHHLEKISYSGDIVLEAYRGSSGDEVATVKSHIDFLFELFSAAKQ
jgi:hexulose-6-phosphate isomerase